MPLLRIGEGLLCPGQLLRLPVYGTPRISMHGPRGCTMGGSPCSRSGMPKSSPALMVDDDPSGDAMLSCELVQRSKILAMHRTSALISLHRPCRSMWQSSSLSN